MATGDDAAMRQHLTDHLAECQREGAVLCNDLIPTVQRLFWCLTKRQLIRSYDLETPVAVAGEMKDWINVCTVKHWAVSWEASGPPGLPFNTK